MYILGVDANLLRNGDVGGLPVLVENSLVLQDVLDARLGEVGSMNSFCR